MTITPIRASHTAGRIIHRSPEPAASHVVTVRRCTLDCCAGAEAITDGKCCYCGINQDGDAPDRSTTHIARDLAAVHREAEAHRSLTGAINADRADDVYDLLCELDSTTGAALAEGAHQL